MNMVQSLNWSENMQDNCHCQMFNNSHGVTLHQYPDGEKAEIFQYVKGQEISEDFFLVFKCSKEPTKLFHDFCLTKGLK